MLVRTSHLWVNKLDKFDQNFQDIKMTDYQSKFKETIESKLIGLEDASRIYGSIIAEATREKKVRPIDVNGAIGCYRSMVELVALLRVYNTQFSDSGMEQLQRSVEPVLDKTEELLLSIIKSHPNVIN